MKGHDVDFDEHMMDVELMPGDLREEIPEKKPKKAANKHQNYAEVMADEHSTSVNLLAMAVSLLKRSGAPLNFEEEAKENNKAAKRSKKKPDEERQIGRYANVEYLDLTAELDARMKEIEEKREKHRQEIK